jgi:hypothetical protein
MKSLTWISNFKYLHWFYKDNKYFLMNSSYQVIDMAGLCHLCFRPATQVKSPKLTSYNGVGAEQKHTNKGGRGAILNK